MPGALSTAPGVPLGPNTFGIAVCFWLSSDFFVHLLRDPFDHKEGIPKVLESIGSDDEK
ncbi:hypothetical protein RUM44_009086 [Polyplax serrata]|uniref:Uncharacterized protein n=1 Tax=Polyplax serrata TaxID=468196 RepID=A0ABR1ARN8_POLSC